MKVIIEIPQNIIKLCLDNDFEEKTIQVLFQTFLKKITQDSYNQFETEFDNWLQDIDDLEMEDILQEAQEEEDFPRICG
jgi:hypothetical protein